MEGNVSAHGSLTVQRGLDRHAAPGTAKQQRCILCKAHWMSMYFYSIMPAVHVMSLLAILQ